MLNKEGRRFNIIDVSTDTYMKMVSSAMNQLLEILGEDDFESMQRLLDHVNQRFDQLIFEDELSADEIESMHNVAQAVSAMMEMRMIEVSSMM